MPKKTQKPNFTPIIITLTIDPALKLNDQGERAMSTSIVARRGNVAQISHVDVTNWKTDLPGEVDRLVRLLLGGGLVLPAFPNMGDAKTTGGSATANEPEQEAGADDAEQDAAADDIAQDGEAVDPPSEADELVEPEPDGGDYPGPDEGDYPDPSLTDEEIEASAEAIWPTSEQAEGELPPAA